MDPANPTSTNQQGFVLIVGMVMMLATTVMAIPRMKMATRLKDRGQP